MVPFCLINIADSCQRLLYKTVFDFLTFIYMFPIAWSFYTTYFWQYPDEII